MGGQKGRVGKTLVQTETPDEVQVVGIDISKVVTEYQAQIIEYEQEIALLVSSLKVLTALFNRVWVSKRMQFTYPNINDSLYNSSEKCFVDQLGVPIGAGSLFNFNFYGFNSPQLATELLTK